MRFVLALVVVVLAGGPVHAEEEAARVAPFPDAEEGRPRFTPEPPKPEAVAHLVLEGTDVEQRFAAQYLQTAETETVLAIGQALRAAKAASGEAPRPRDVREAAQRALEGPFVDVTSLLLELPRALLGFERGATQRVLTADHVRRILRVCESGAGVIAHAPRLTIAEKQRAHVTVLRQHRYVRDVETRRAGTEAIAVPKTGTLQEGMAIAVRPRVEPAGASVWLDATVTCAEVPTPFAERRVVVGSGTATMHRPVCYLHATRHQVSVPLGGALVVRLGDATGTPGRQWVALVQPTKVHTPNRDRNARAPATSGSGGK